MHKYYTVAFPLIYCCLSEYTFIHNSGQSMLKLLVAIQVPVYRELQGHTFKYKWHEYSYISLLLKTVNPDWRDCFWRVVAGSRQGEWVCAWEVTCLWPLKNLGTEETKSPVFTSSRSILGRGSRCESSPSGQRWISALLLPLAVGRAS